MRFEQEREPVLAKTSQLRVQRLASPAELSALARECDQLMLSMSPRLPFATSTWLELWWRHYGEQRLLVHDRFFVHALRDETGTLRAIAPLMLTERPGTGPLRARTVAFFGADKSITELRGMICAPEMEALAVSSLLSHFKNCADEWDWFTWHGVRRGSEAYQTLDSEANYHWTRETTDHVLALSASWEEFRSSRSRNIKESLRKCYNSLKRDGHEFRFRVVSHPAELPAALTRFMTLHASRAQASELVPHANVFAEHRARDLLSGIAARPTPALSLRVFQLEIGGQVVAARLGFVLGDELYLYFSGFEPAWGKYSVMTTTVAETLKWAIEQGIKSVNLSPGTDVSKTRWGAEAIATHHGVLVSPGRRGQWVFRLLTELNERSRQGKILGSLVARARRLG
ncbi:MAG TPA: GNAT family N-acetyltransferase [Polyangiaceae bacterium]|nr:GNAT family N-acetyltransferase [Polyangiaceae bacterium]